jgi:hypothetical protein
MASVTGVIADHVSSSTTDRTESIVSIWHELLLLAQTCVLQKWSPEVLAFHGHEKLEWCASCLFYCDERAGAVSTEWNA